MYVCMYVCMQRTIEWSSKGEKDTTATARTLFSSAKVKEGACGYKGVSHVL